MFVCFGFLDGFVGWSRDRSGGMGRGGGRGGRKKGGGGEERRGGERRRKGGRGEQGYYHLNTQQGSEPLISRQCQ